MGFLSAWLLNHSTVVNKLFSWPQESSGFFVLNLLLLPVVVYSCYLIGTGHTDDVPDIQNCFAL